MTWQGLQLLASMQRSAERMSVSAGLAALVCGALCTYLLKSFILPLALAEGLSSKLPSKPSQPMSSPWLV